jgi:hypothetical protein
MVPAVSREPDAFISPSETTPYGNDFSIEASGIICQQFADAEVD